MFNLCCQFLSHISVHKRFTFVLKLFFFSLFFFFLLHQYKVSIHKTSLIPPLFIKVTVSSQESEWLCICALGMSNLPLYTIFLRDFWTVSTVHCVFVFHFMYMWWSQFMLHIHSCKSNYHTITTSMTPSWEIRIVSWLALTEQI